MAADDHRGGPPGSSLGPATDRTNQPVQDPTPNVLDLVRAETKRQDDLRRAEAQHNREVATIRHDYEQQLRQADRYEADVRSKYEDRLREKETQRLDAIRTVDVANVESARVLSEARANTLATQ